jgi:hypothetical protein
LNLRPPGYETSVAGSRNVAMRVVTPVRSAQVGLDQLRRANVEPKIARRPRRTRSLAAVLVDPLAGFHLASPSARFRAALLDEALEASQVAANAAPVYAK